VGSVYTEGVPGHVKISFNENDPNIRFDGSRHIAFFL
jgi:hypothetical protein